MSNGFEISGGQKAAVFLKELRLSLKEASSVEVGFFPEDIHPKNNVPVASVAFTNEVGDPLNTFEGHPAPIPPRPFMRQTEAESSPEWGKAFFSGLKAVQYHSAPAMKGLGNLIQMQIRNSIFNWASPMNSPVTIRLKGLDDPLVETGFMADHVKVKVKE
jgi:hypothetical protein